MQNELFTNVRTNFYLQDESNNTLKHLSYDQFNQLLKSGKYLVKFSYYSDDLSDELVTDYTLQNRCVFL